MANLKNPSAPATKADLEDLRTFIEETAEETKRHFDVVALYHHVRDRGFEDVDQHSVRADQQFQRFFNYAHAENNEHRLHAKNRAEIRRHFDLTTENLYEDVTDFFRD